MSSIGHYLLLFSWLLTLFAMVAGCVASAQKHEGWFEATRRSTYFAAGTLLLSLGALAWLFETDDYSIQYVWQYSNRAMPSIYKFTAIWGGMDGSMLLWALFVSLFGAILAFTITSIPRHIGVLTLAALNSSTLFFLTVTLFLTNPFRGLKSPFIPPDGNGLNPLLQNAYMAIHPPMLYLGFTGLAIPYAFAIGSLLVAIQQKRLGATSQLALKSGVQHWITYSRPWTLIAWGFLTIGIFLGGHWAYLELGWGGFWAWDPVENASFLPWLTATALLHSVMVQRKNGSLAIWNYLLIIVTYSLTVFGTFLTRSGVVQSVHAFASTNVGWIFLTYLGIIAVSSAVLLLAARSHVKSEARIQNLFSRETIFLLNNLVLLCITFAIIWGVLYPVFSEALTGSQATVGPSFFNAVTIPMFLGLIFLMAIGPFTAWKSANVKYLIRSCGASFIGAILVAMALVWGGVDQFYPTLAYGIATFVILTVGNEFHRITKTHGATQESVIRKFNKQRSRYGGLIVHVGVAVATIAITASMAHKIEQEFTLAPGESINIGQFSFKLNDFRTQENQNYEALAASVTVSTLRSGQLVQELLPEIRRYRRNDETTTEVALHIGLAQDIYVILAGTDEKGEKAALKVFINPLQIWLWIGGIIMVLGTLVVLTDRAFQSRIASQEVRS